MKSVVFTILQLILLLIVFFVGSIFPPFHFERVLIATPGTTRIFVADGLVLAFVLYILIVILEVARKRLHTAAPWTTLAFLLAVVFGLMMKFGFKTISAF